MDKFATHFHVIDLSMIDQILHTNYKFSMQHVLAL